MLSAESAVGQLFNLMTLSYGITSLVASQYDFDGHLK